MATIGYAGSRGIDLAGVANLNNVDPVQIGGRLVFTGQQKPNPNFDTIRVRHTGYDSWYNSMQLNVTHRYSQGLQSTAHTLLPRTSTRSPVFRQPATRMPDPIRFRSMVGPTFIKGFLHSMRGMCSASTRRMTCPLAKPSRGAPKQIVAGWQLGGIVSLRSGFAETVNISNRLSELRCE